MAGGRQAMRDPMPHLAWVGRAQEQGTACRSQETRVRSAVLIFGTGGMLRLSRSAYHRSALLQAAVEAWEKMQRRTCILLHIMPQAATWQADLMRPRCAEHIQCLLDKFRPCTFLSKCWPETPSKHSAILTHS